MSLTVNAIPFKLLLAILLLASFLPALADDATGGVAPAEPVELPLRPFPEETLYQLLLGEVAGHRKDFQQALASYSEQAEATRDLAVIKRAARLAKYLNEVEPAADAARLWLEQEPDNIEALDLLAATQRKKQELLPAFDTLLRARQLGQEADFSRIAASSLDLEPKATLDLLQRFDQALDEFPKDVDLLMGQAIAKQRFDPDKAASIARKARRLAPESKKPRAIGIEATILQRSGRTDKALKLLAKETEERPRHRALNLQYARILTQYDLVKARNTLESIYALYPGDGEIAWTLALVSYELTLYDDAINLMELVSDDYRYGDQANYYLGEIHLQHGRLARAAYHYEQVGPGNDFVNALLKLARLRIASDEMALFRDHLAQLRRIYPNEQIDIYLFEAELLTKLDSHADAMAVLGEAIEAFPDNSNLRFARSLAHERGADFARAETDLRHILAREPDNSTALNALGYMLTVHTQRYEEALELIKQALTGRPDDAAILDSLGWVNFKMGNLEQGLLYLQAAYSRDQDPEIAAHLGEVLWLLERRREAMDVWNQALESEPTNKHVMEAMTRLGAAETATKADSIES